MGKAFWILAAAWVFFMLLFGASVAACIEKYGGIGGMLAEIANEYDEARD